MQENELVEKAIAGNQWALEQLLKDNYPLVFGYLAKITMDHETAKDITQETMVRAITHIGSFKGNSKFSSWLISIASNLYKDSIKKHKPIPVDMEALDGASAVNTEDQAIQHERMEALRKNLMQLSTQERKGFILKHYYNYSYEEIAKILDCPVGTVRSRLHYCIAKLKDRLKGDE